MGIEIFLIVLIAIAAVAATVFFTGSFGVAKAAREGGRRERRPTHVYVENETEERNFGSDGTEHVRRRAEEDPDTEVRA